MVRPDDYVPPGARTELPRPTFRQRYGDPLLATAFFSAGVAVWTVAVAGRGLEPRWGFIAGVAVTVGLFGAVRPAWGFAFGERWTYREEPEPSSAYLVVTRVLGVVMLAVGLGLGLALSPSTAAPEDTGGVVPGPSFGTLDG